MARPRPDREMIRRTRRRLASGPGRRRDSQILDMHWQTVRLTALEGMETVERPVAFGVEGRGRLGRLCAWSFVRPVSGRLPSTRHARGSCNDLTHSKSIQTECSSAMPQPTHHTMYGSSLGVGPATINTKGNGMSLMVSWDHSSRVQSADGPRPPGHSSHAGQQLQSQSLNAS